MNKNKLLCLDVGSNTSNVASMVFSNDEVEFETLDINPAYNPTYVHDITQPFPEEMYDKYDILFVSHVLEHIDRVKVLDTLRNLRKILKEGGEIWVIVPSLEWAANQIVMQDTLPTSVQAVIFGGQLTEYDYHKCGFTLASLRQVLGMTEYLPRKAYQGSFGIELYSGKIETAAQNIVIAVKYTPREGEQ